MTDMHSCSYYCDRPECVKAQRDDLLAENERLRAVLHAAPEPSTSAWCLADYREWYETLVGAVE